MSHFFVPGSLIAGIVLFLIRRWTDWQLILSLSETSLIVSIFAMFNLLVEFEMSAFFQSFDDPFCTNDVD